MKWKLLNGGQGDEAACITSGKGIGNEVKREF